MPCCPMGAVFLEIRPVDVAAAVAAGQYNRIWREPMLASSGAGPGSTPLDEAPAVRLRAQLEMREVERLRMRAGGNSPVTEVVALIWAEDLTAAGLADAGGAPTISENARLTAVLSASGAPVVRIRRPAYLQQIVADSYCCDGSVQVWRALFGDRRT